MCHFNIALAKSALAYLIRWKGHTNTNTHTFRCKLFSLCDCYLHIRRRLILFIYTHTHTHIHGQVWHVISEYGCVLHFMWRLIIAQIMNTPIHIFAKCTQTHTIYLDICMCAYIYIHTYIFIYNTCLLAVFRLVVGNCRFNLFVLAIGKEQKLAWIMVELIIFYWAAVFTNTYTKIGIYKYFPRDHTTRRQLLVFF